MSYDLLGRMTQRVEPDMTCGVGLRQRAARRRQARDGQHHGGAGRRLPAQLRLRRARPPGPGGDHHQGGTTYTSRPPTTRNSRLSTVTYPSGFALNYTYTRLGYVQQLKAAATGQVYWTANARDAELHLTQQTAGNGVVTTQSFDAQTGRLPVSWRAPATGPNFSYTYDLLGNMLTRQTPTEA